MLPRPGIDLPQERLDFFPNGASEYSTRTGISGNASIMTKPSQQLCWIVSFWRPARSFVQLPSHLRHNREGVEVRTCLPFSKRRK
jgi:hypothetical protein